MSELIIDTDTDRRTFLGGSDAAAVLGVSPWKTPVQLWLEKTGQASYEPTPEQQRRFDRGKKLEPFIIEMGIDKLREQGHDVELIATNERFSDGEYPYFSCEIDARLSIDGVICTCDAKSVHGFARNKWGEEDTDQIPIEYAAQFMFGLGILTDVPTCVVFSLIGLDDVAIYWLHRDDETITNMRRQCAEFWCHCVIDGHRPDPLDYNDVSLLYPRDNDGSIEATPEIAELIESYRQGKQRQKLLADDLEGMQKQIAQFMSPNATITVDDKPRLTWKSQNRTGIDTKRLRAELPELARDYTTSTPVRVMRLKSLPKESNQ